MALPIDIMINIFLKLPVKSFLRCECVCKLWRNTINTPYFADRHRRSSDARECPLQISRYVNEESTTVKIYTVNLEIDSNSFTLSQHPISEFTYEPVAAHFHNLGNGLFLVGAVPPRGFKYPGFLYNPIRRQRLNLPPPDINTGEINLYSSAYGLCFDESSKQYKLVRVSPLLSGTIKFATEVYTLGSNKWKQIAAVPPYQVHGTATPAYGDLHWAVGLSWEQPERYLVSFEIIKEEFKVTPMPRADDSSIFSWREELALLSNTAYTNTPRVRIFVLRDYDNNSKWEEVYALTFPTRIDGYNFGIWNDGIVFRIGRESLLVKRKIIGRDYCQLLHWNTKEGLVTPIVYEPPTERPRALAYEAYEFTSSKFNLVSLANVSL